MKKAALKDKEKWMNMQQFIANNRRGINLADLGNLSYLGCGYYRIIPIEGNENLQILDLKASKNDPNGASFRFESRTQRARQLKHIDEIRHYMADQFDAENLQDLISPTSTEEAEIAQQAKPTKT